MASSAVHYYLPLPPSYLISWNHILFKNIAHDGSFSNFVFVFVNVNGIALSLFVYIYVLQHAAGWPKHNAPSCFVFVFVFVFIFVFVFVFINVFVIVDDISG